MIAKFAECWVFDGPGLPLRREQIPFVPLRNGEVRVRLRACTLCGSDLHTYRGRRSGPAPTILGHEMIGVIEELGPGAAPLAADGSALQIGERVVWSVAVSCGDCFFCRIDLSQKCNQLIKYGHEPLSAGPLGGLATHCHLRENTAIVRVQDDLPDEEEAPASCATATVAAVLRAAGDVSGQTILVIGAGMLGLTACAFARFQGAARIVVCDVAPERLALARTFGADAVFDMNRQLDDLRAFIAAATNGRGVDAALELSGSSDATSTALDLLRIGGRLILAGAVFPTPELAVRPEMVVRRLLRIEGVHNYRSLDLLDAVRFLSVNYQRFPFRELVAKRFDLDCVPVALEFAERERPVRVAIVMR